MWMPLKEISSGGDGNHDPGPRVALAARVADQLPDGLGACAGELTEQLRLAPKQRAQQARDGEHHMAVRDGQQHVFAKPLGPQELLLLLARGAEAAAAAGENQGRGERVTARVEAGAVGAASRPAWPPRWASRAAGRGANALAKRRNITITVPKGIIS